MTARSSPWSRAASDGGASYAETVDARGAARERAAVARHRRRPAGRDVHVEQRGAPGGVPRGAVMGAVLHTLNIRLFPEQVDLHRQPRRGQVIIVDGSLVPLLAKVLPEMTTVHTVLVDRRRRLSALEESGKRILSYEAVLAGARADVRLARGRGRTVRRRDVLHERHDRQPEGRRLLAPLVLAALDVGLYRQRQRPRRRRPDAADRADVPRERVGHCRTPRSCPAPTCVMPDRYLQAEPLIGLIEAEQVTIVRRRCRRSGTTSCSTCEPTPAVTSRRCGRSCAAAPRCRGR